MNTTGLIVGKFYPLHQGHLHMILSASLEVDMLHVFVCSETARDHELFLESAFTKTPTSEDRIEWAKISLSEIPNIKVHGFNEDGIPSYPNGWEAWSDRLKDTLAEKSIAPTLIFSSEPQDKAFYETHFGVQVKLVDPPRDAFPVSATKIRTTPFQYWTFIPTIIRPFFTKIILVETDSIQPKLLMMIQKLYNTVEVPAFPKIQFIAINHDNLEPILESQMRDNRIISAIIASPALIKQYQKKSSQTQQIHSLVLQGSIHHHNLAEHSHSSELITRQQFQKAQLFINDILKES